jgi:hypothetical protein
MYCREYQPGAFKNHRRVSVKQQACPDAPPWEQPMENEGLGYPANRFKIKFLQQK